MTTRARAAGGVTKEQFEGRVRKWVKQWTPVQGDRKAGDATLRLLKWVQTDERTETPPGPRRPDIRPVTDPRNKAVAPRAKPKPKRGFVVTLKRPAKSTANPDEAATTEMTEGGGGGDNDEDVVSQQPATSLGTERRMSAGTPQLDGVSSELLPEMGLERATASSAQPTQPALKLRLSKPSTPPLKPDAEVELMELD